MRATALALILCTTLSVVNTLKFSRCSSCFHPIASIRMSLSLLGSLHGIHLRASGTTLTRGASFPRALERTRTHMHARAHAHTQTIRTWQLLFEAGARDGVQSLADATAAVADEAYQRQPLQATARPNQSARTLSLLSPTPARERHLSCVRARTHALFLKHAHTRTHTCTHARTHTYTQVRARMGRWLVAREEVQLGKPIGEGAQGKVLCIHIYGKLYIYTHKHTHMHIYWETMDACVCVCVCVCVYIYIYMYIYMYP